MKLIDKKIKNEIITIATDFTDTVGARDKRDGDYSGEEFYEKLLKEKVRKAKKNNTKVFIDFDNSWGYPSSFISGAFGRLGKKFGKDIYSILEIKSDEDSSLESQIKNAIEEGYY